MSTSRFLDLWSPPAGYRLASIMATTYHLHADFLEEDLLPVALGLRQSSARGREFRIELEQALQDTDVTIYLHPDGYQPGLRRSPRVDLIPLPEARTPKLHAKVGLLRFVPETGGGAVEEIVRLVVGSANLTASGYRTNIEIGVALDDAPGGDETGATAVRDAAAWLRGAIPPATDQARAQHRSMQAIFDARPIDAARDGLSFIGMPRQGGLTEVLSAIDAGDIRTLTVVSPFWPTGEEPGDVVSALFKACGGTPQTVRLAGPACEVDGILYPEMPPALLRALTKKGVAVEVAYADPRYACSQTDSKPISDGDEYGDMGATRDKAAAWRPLHAKALLLEGSRASILAAGSFNFTRKGLGVHDRASNTEAGVIWSLPAKSGAKFAPLFDFVGPWRKVDDAPEEMVKAPGPMDGKSGQLWPAFIHSIRASREGVMIEGDGATWPAVVRLSMRDIRARLVQLQRDFDPWVIVRPPAGQHVNETLRLTAAWLEEDGQQSLARYPALADLDITLEWDGQQAVLPVVFVDKHEFPLVERASREDERALIDWFLGLRPAGESEPDGFGHGIDPSTAEQPPETGGTAGILSYLLRDFVHALPGIRARLEEGAATETGLRSALLGPRSPAKLADEILAAWKRPGLGQPRKTEIATAFQLIELRQLVAHVSLPALPDGMTDQLRAQCIEHIDTTLVEVTSRLKPSVDPALKRYLEAAERAQHATP